MSVRKAAIYSILNQSVTKLLSLISVMIVARLLTPAELGLYAIAASIAFIASEFRTLGTASYLIREKEVVEQTKRACVGLSLIISWGMCLLLIVSASTIRDFYQLPDLEILLWLLAVSFVVAPFTVVPFSMMSKHLSYGGLCVIAVSSQLINIGVTLLCIFNGASYFSMAYGLAAGEIWRTCLFYFYAKRDFFLMPSFLNMREILKSGVFVSLGNLFKRFSLMSFDLIIGRLGTTKEVALNSRAVGFGDFIVNVTTMGISSFALSYIAKEKNEDGNVPLAFTRATNVMLSLVWPALTIAVVLKDELIMVFFGEQWGFSASLFPGIAVWMMLSSVWALSTSMYIANNAEKFRAYKELFLLLITVVTVYLAYPYGLSAIAYSMILVGCVDLLVNLFALKYIARLSMRTFLVSISNNVIMTLCVGAWAYLLKLYVDVDNAFLTVIVVAALSLPIWIGCMKLVRLELYTEISKVFVKLTALNTKPLL